MELPAFCAAEKHAIDWPAVLLLWPHKCFVFAATRPDFAPISSGGGSGCKSDHSQLCLKLKNNKQREMKEHQESAGNVSCTDFPAIRKDLKKSLILHIFFSASEIGVKIANSKPVKTFRYEYQQLRMHATASF